MRIFFLTIVMLFALCSGDAAGGELTRSLTVTATGYTSRPSETLGDPFLTAWGHVLEPGIKAIAVSQDLIPLGLTDGTRVRIKGLEGEYLVLDKMPSRWRKKIDIYFGTDVNKAKQWGVREVTIFWAAP
ncbi:MAG: 3D domain-containing protein [Desulfovibrionales bacterium]